MLHCDHSLPLAYPMTECLMLHSETLGGKLIQAIISLLFHDMEINMQLFYF